MIYCIVNVIEIREMLPENACLIPVSNALCDGIGIIDLFKGQTLIAYSTDPMIAPKVVMDFAKTNDKVVVLGGAMGATTLNAEAVKSLATLPSLDELRGRLLGMSQTPATRIASVVAAPASQLAPSTSSVRPLPELLII
jgi:ribosomal protein L10